MMRSVYTSVFVFAALCARPPAVVSQPLDGEAAKILRMVGLVQDAGKERTLSDSELASVIAASKSGGWIVRMASAYALAFTKSEAGEKALLALASDDDSDVAGVAEFSLLRKQCRGLKGQQRLPLLTFSLGRCQRPWTRILLVMWLGDEYQEAVVPLFLAALETEKEALVRAELLFQIAIHCDLVQLKGIESLLEKEPPSTAEALGEYWETFLNMISRNQTRRGSGMPSRFFLRDVLEGRMKAMGNKP